MRNTTVINVGEYHSFVNSIVNWYVAGKNYESNPDGEGNLSDLIVLTVELSTVILNMPKSNLLVSNYQFYNDLIDFKDNWGRGYINGENLQKVIAGFYSLGGNIKGPVGGILLAAGNI